MRNLTRGQEGKSRSKTLTAGRWRCGGSSQKASCTSHRRIFKNGTLQGHDTRGGGGQLIGAKKTFSKGGDGTGGKDDWKSSKPKIGAVNLPPVAKFTIMQLKAFIAQANLVSESCKEASQPKKCKIENSILSAGLRITSGYVVKGAAENLISFHDFIDKGSYV